MIASNRTMQVICKVEVAKEINKQNEILLQNQMQHLLFF